MPAESPVTVARNGALAILTLAVPPVNTLNRPMRRALMTALREADDDPGIRAIVLTGKENFCAGADLAEFDSGDALAEPTLHLTITGMLDAMRTPSVAAISGVALGGGLELALACTARVARPDVGLGLPESTLGFMPGAGGTQRLPRLVGIETALDLILTGRRIDGDESLRIGLVDEVTDDILAAAGALALRLADSGRRPRARDVSVTEPLAAGLIDLARRDAHKARAGDGIFAALDALEAAVTVPFEEGLARELAAFEQLVGTPAARAARYRFLSERSAPRVPGTARPIRSVAVVGGGTMGRGIAMAFLAADTPTTIIDTDSERVTAAVARIEEVLDTAVSRGRLTPAERDARRARLSPVVGVEGAADADLVIEAVFEKLDVKREVFAELDRIARADAVLASNTSSLDLDAIASATARPESVVGMHFFSPANVMRLVEVVKGGATSDDTLATALASLRRLRKTVVIAQNGPGFIGNRLFDAAVRQAQLLMIAGASPARIDSVLEAWGMAMGPFRVLDVVGNDIPALARAERGDTDPVWSVANTLAERGLLGRKSGSGWYDYAAQTPTPNPEVEGLLPAVTTAAPTDSDIAMRYLYALVNEAAAALADGIAASSRDIDTVLVNGYGFPAARGGAWFAAEDAGWDAVVAAMRRFRRETSDAFWEPHPSLVTLAEAAP